MLEFLADLIVFLVARHREIDKTYQQEQARISYQKQNKCTKSTNSDEFIANLDVDHHLVLKTGINQVGCKNYNQYKLLQ